MIRVIILLVATATLLLGLAVLSAGPGYRFDLWSLGTAFDILSTAGPWLAYGGIASIVALVLGVVTRQRGIVLPCLVAAACSGILTYSLIEQRRDARANPIHDLTTDVDNPPAIVAAAGLERSNPAEYGGSSEYKSTGKSVIKWQQELYPDIKPQVFAPAPNTVFAAARATAEDMGFNVLDTNENNGVIEAAYTSPWFGFIDDVIIRVSPADNGGSRVDMRSKSRVGGSDLGANARRIRQYQAKLAGRLST